MFGSISPSRGRRTASTRRLWLETLEGRDCPSTFVPGNTPVDVINAYNTQQSTNQYADQYVLNFQYTVLSGPNVEFTGRVTAGTSGNVANQVVEFQGAINGYVVADGGGYFDFITNAIYPASVDAAVVPGVVGGDGTMMAAPGPVQSHVLQEVLTANAVQITDFTIIKKSAYRYEFKGTVSGANGGGLTVTLNGQPVTLQQNPRTVPVNPDGSFDVFIDLDNGAADEGEVLAQVFSNGQPVAQKSATVYDVG